MSTHAPHMFSGFIKGELTRYARLSSNPFAYNHTKKLFYQRLVQRGYKRRYLNRIFNRHSWQSRFQDNESPAGAILPFVLPYTLRDNVKNIQSILRQHYDDIDNWFPIAQVIFAHSKRPNVHNHLCSSALSTQHKEIMRSRNDQGSQGH